MAPTFRRSTKFQVADSCALRELSFPTPTGLQPQRGFQHPQIPAERPLLWFTRLLQYSIQQWQRMGFLIAGPLDSIRSRRLPRPEYQYLLPLGKQMRLEALQGRHTAQP